jgi:hypothetical protein
VVVSRVTITDDASLQAAKPTSARWTVWNKARMRTILCAAERSSQTASESNIRRAQRASAVVALDRFAAP